MSTVLGSWIKRTGTIGSRYMIPDPSTKTHLRAYSQVLQLHPENEAEHKAYKICFFSIADVGHVAAVMQIHVKQGV